jgi:hypothetical protein
MTSAPKVHLSSRSDSVIVAYNEALAAFHSARLMEIMLIGLKRVGKRLPAMLVHLHLVQIRD